MFDHDSQPRDWSEREAHGGYDPRDHDNKPEQKDHGMEEIPDLPFRHACGIVSDTVKKFKEYNRYEGKQKGGQVTLHLHTCLECGSTFSIKSNN